MMGVAMVKPGPTSIKQMQHKLNLSKIWKPFGKQHHLSSFLALGALTVRPLYCGQGHGPFYPCTHQSTSNLPVILNKRQSPILKLKDVLGEGSINMLKLCMKMGFAHYVCRLVDSLFISNDDIVIIVLGHVSDPNKKHQ